MGSPGFAQTRRSKTLWITTEVLDVVPTAGSSESTGCAIANFRMPPAAAAGADGAAAVDVAGAADPPGEVVGTELAQPARSMTLAAMANTR